MMASKNKIYTSGLQFEAVVKLIGSSLKRIETKCGGYEDCVTSPRASLTVSCQECGLVGYNLEVR